MHTMGDLSNDELLARLEAHVGNGHVWQAGLIAYLAEVEERRLHLEVACSSMFDFCVHRLGMSDGEAHRRLIASRLVRAFPRVLGYLERGDVHLCALALLRDHMTEENHEELLRAATGKTVRTVQEMLAARCPKPDVPPRIEPLAPQGELPVAPPDAPRPEMSKPRPRVEPLSPSRYRVELTVSEEAKEKLARIKDLMRHRNPNGDLEVIVEQALDLLLAKLEKERLGKVARPRKAKAPAAPEQAEQTEAAPAFDDPSRHIPQEVRRAVFERDGERCTYVDARGRRCSCRGFLELDHVVPFARGGKPTLENLRVRCRAHNRWYAEQQFGRAHVEEQIHLRQRKCEGVETGSFVTGSFEAAARGLKNLGFRDADVRRVLATLEEELDGAGGCQRGDHRSRGAGSPHVARWPDARSSGPGVLAMTTATVGTNAFVHLRRRPRALPRARPVARRAAVRARACRGVDPLATTQVRRRRARFVRDHLVRDRGARPEEPGLPRRRRLTRARHARRQARSVGGCQGGDHRSRGAGGCG